MKKSIIRLGESAECGFRHLVFHVGSMLEVPAFPQVDSTVKTLLNELFLC
jgi:hypothetical protein